MVNRFVIRFVANIKHHNGTVVATSGNQGWTSRMEVNAHHARLSGEGVLGPGRVLDSEAADKASGLLQEVIRTVGDGEHILVLRVPIYGCHILPPALLGRETPEGKDRTEATRLGVVGVVLVVLVVGEDDVVCVLDNHALHDLEASLHRGAVKWILLMNLHDLLGLLVSASQFGSFFKLQSLLVFVLLHVGVENLPLCGLNGEDRCLGRVGFDTALTNWQVEGLGSSLLVVEHVPQ